MRYPTFFHQLFGFGQQNTERIVKTTTPTIFPGRGTDASIGPSIFDLPVENLRKLQESEKESEQDDKDKVG